MSPKFKILQLNPFLLLNFLLADDLKSFRFKFGSCITFWDKGQSLYRPGQCPLCQVYGQLFRCNVCKMKFWPLAPYNGVIINYNSVNVCYNYFSIQAYDQAKTNYGGNRLLSKLKYKYEPIQNLFLANTKWRRNISKQSDNQNTSQTIMLVMTLMSPSMHRTVLRHHLNQISLTVVWKIPSLCFSRLWFWHDFIYDELIHRTELNRNWNEICLHNVSVLK